MDEPLTPSDKSKQESRWNRAYHSPLGQTLLLALICFCIQGTFNSLISMAGGIDEATAAAATMVSFGVAIPSGIFSPLVAVRLGTRVSACVATIGYIIYAASMFGYSKGVIGAAGVIAGGAALGVGGGLFCTVQIWRLTGVPAPEDEGTHVAWFYFVFNSGAVVGGLISFATNYSQDSGERTASAGMFVAFLAIMGAGSLLCLALQPLHKLRAARGASSGVPPAVGARTLLRLLSDVRALALLPLFVFTIWGFSYQFVCFNARIFNARTQARTLTA